MTFCCSMCLFLFLLFDTNPIIGAVVMSVSVLLSVIAIMLQCNV